ncbi:unnamed protein product [Trifolium pratense]|uniref:Uncharacterized protein n=2 Tax=Trifolium pratense TaxID=57577 RepID=A0ACB0KA37_TRIPR|nr:unnamed protein product [Trifolium pratense]
MPKNPEEESESESAYENEKSQTKIVTDEEEEVSSDVVVNSQSGESEKTVSNNEEENMSVDKVELVVKVVVDADDLDSKDQPLEKSLGPSIAKRLRNMKGCAIYKQAHCGIQENNWCWL